MTVWFENQFSFPIIMEEPPCKRPHYENFIIYYYELGTAIIPIMNLDPERDLPGFNGSLVPDYLEDIDPGATEDFPLWVPPCLWNSLMASPNPIMEMAEANMLLKNVAVKCRDKHTLNLIHDLRESANLKASEYWTDFYDQIVDSICQDGVPWNPYLPTPENIIFIARWVKNIAGNEEMATTRKLYPELFINSYGESFPLWVLREIVTATGKHKKFLKRVMRLFPNLKNGPPETRKWRRLKDGMFEECLRVYWRWRNYEYSPSEDGMYDCITENVDFRHAILYENTGKMFKRYYSDKAKYFFKGEYRFRISVYNTTMVDPITGDIVDLATCKDVWTPELVEYVSNRDNTHSIQPPVTQHALRELSSASITVFSQPPFNVHPLLTCLLNKKPTRMSYYNSPAINFRHIQGVPRKNLYWDNIENIPGDSIHTIINISTSLPVTLPTNIRDLESRHTCFDPRIRRVLMIPYATFITRLFMNIIQQDEVPLGNDLDKLLRANKGKGRYSINKHNSVHWRFLELSNALYLFPETVQKVARKVHFY